MLLQFQRTNRLLRLNQFRDMNDRIGWGGMKHMLSRRTESMFGEQSAWRDWIRRKIGG